MVVEKSIPEGVSYQCGKWDRHNPNPSKTNLQTILYLNHVFIIWKFDFEEF
jgi:hypothetical protein